MKMFCRKALHPMLSCGILGALISVPAAAAPRLSTVTPQAALTIADPINLQKVQDLDFGSLSVNGAGTATINPVTNVQTLTNGLQRVAGSPHAAEFRINSNRSAIFFIRIPTNPIVLRNSSNQAATMTVTNWTLDGSQLRIKVGSGSILFRVGGRLNVNAGQAEGQYLGSFEVTAEYL